MLKNLLTTYDCKSAETPSGADKRHIRRGGTKLCNIQVKMQGMGGDNLSYSYHYLYKHN